ncbi:hypothetical protein HY333_01905, partial [Candidatus Collierbacteria bacterium]|nr:hypothetical protein [Candidatus Collierbacteria bacterium]
MLAVEAEMKGLARHFEEDENLWGLAGLLHDADYELFKDDPKKHPSMIFTSLTEQNVNPQIIQAIKAHAWGWQDDAPEPQSKMDWALYTADDLSGMIIACALVRPDKKLTSVTVDSVLKKWPDRSFAKGVHREHIELCQPKLGISLSDFINICLESIKNIAPDLGL